MDTYRTFLYLHLVSLAIGVGAAAVLVVCLYQLKAAQTLAEAVPWASVAGKTEKAFPVAIVGLFVTGAYMTHDVWSWDTGWIAVSLAGLILVALQGPLVAELLSSVAALRVLVTSTRPPGLATRTISVSVTPGMTQLVRTPSPE